MEERTWMWENRLSDTYSRGVDEFIKFAREHVKGKLIRCPCLECGNNNSLEIDIVEAHLIANGIMTSYKKWYFHGEDSDDDVEEGDNMRGMINNLEEEFVEKPNLFVSMMNDAETPLYEGCESFTKLSFLVKLFHLKASGGWTNTSFTRLLETLKDAFPKDNMVPVSMYEAKKTLSTLGMKYEKFHACPNDCILYRHEHENLDECPVCKESRWKKDKKPRNGVKGTPVKVLWYIPPIPRFRRMFNNYQHAKNMVWHNEKRLNDGMLRHPADAEQWKTFDATYPQFSSDPRNLRLALSSDGMNPFGAMSNRYSVWPVILVNYNLPPRLCMKRKFLMLTLLISGPSQPGNDIDVYLAPLIDDLKVLWEEGVEIKDAYRQESFKLRAMLMWTINDFPAYGNLSGYSVKCSIGCPICMKDTCSIHLKHGRKTVFLGHRRFLPSNHPFRKLKQAFDGNTEYRPPPRILSGEDVYDMVNDVKEVLGKRKRSAKESLKDNPWKKKSIFYDLPYWKSLYVRHCLDVMHIKKNVCESIVGTLLDDPHKSKDGKKARLDLKEMNIRSVLHLEERGTKIFLPPAKYTLSRPEKIKLCEWLAAIKVPDGHSSNYKSFVSLKDMKLVGMKTHDCHVLLQHMLPLALRGILANDVRVPIFKICAFFNSICIKVIDPCELDSMQSELVKTLCMFEKFFPPAFFDIMIHLTVHLVREVKLCGPVFLRWMYPIERYMKVLKSNVMNYNKPEGSIVENYVAEESVEFCSEYLGKADAIGLPKIANLVSKIANLVSKSLSAGILSTIDRVEWEQACLCVLHNVPEVMSFIDIHLEELKVSNVKKARSEKWLQEEHNRSFQKWLQQRLYKQTGHPEALMKIAGGPSIMVTKYTAWSINGYTFYTRERDNKHPVQNSGVTLLAESLHISSAKDKNPKHGVMNYYGYIEDILELDYCGLRIPVFKCKWADNKHVKVDNQGITIVNFERIGYKNDSFILAAQANQVFYVPDPADPKLSIVVHMKSRNGDDEEDDGLCDIPPFAKELPAIDDGIHDFEEDDVSYLRRMDIDSVCIKN